jgi:SAM-dependent methyltransferase
MGRQDGAVAWDSLRSTYDAVAAKYEARFVDELESKPRDRALLEAFARSVTDPVVEIGCGPGQIGAYVRRQADAPLHVVGVDLSPAMAGLASRRLDGALVADMRSLPFASNRFGGIVAFYSLIHVRREGLVPALAEFRRVLRPGGRVILSAHEGEGELERDEFLDEPVSVVATLFALDELVAAGQRAGLEPVHAERRMPYPSEGETVRLFVEARKPDTEKDPEPDPGPDPDPDREGA